ncbi:MAG: imidazole glycerol phosphate synthase subunit HisH [Pseudomonadota bacterium]
MNVAIIDYGSGNLASAAKAFERAARENDLNATIQVTDDPENVLNADRIVLPGVGAFADCRRGLDAVTGMIEALEEAVMRNARPFFGICVGHQLMATRGLEKETTEGLGWIKGDVTMITPSDATLKIPHMGWNTLTLKTDHPVLQGIPTGPNGLHAYFVHSYHMVSDEAVTLATADYAGDITAIVGRDNLIGTQFHPEKSQVLGLTLIGNFLKWSV